MDMIRHWQVLEKDSARLNDVINQGTDCDLFDCLKTMSPDYLVAVVTHLMNNGDTVLHLAAVRERAGSVRMMLNNKADVNVLDGRGRSPLYACLFHTSMMSARLMLSFGADFNEIVCRRTRESLLHSMIKANRPGAVEFLLRAGAQLEATTADGDTPLHFAARYNRPKVTESLLALGAEINATNNSQQTPLHLAVVYCNLDVAKALIKNKATITTKDTSRTTALHAAVATNSLKMTQLILACNSTQVNSKEPALGRTPLLLACSSNSPEMAALLLSYGADVNLTTNCRKSALHVTACSGHARVLDTLLQHAPNINAAAINNKTALHFAATEGHMNIVKPLLKAGANVNARDMDGNTPLHMASQSGHHNITQALLRHDAYVNAINMHQQTALHLASMAGHRPTSLLLIESGCDPSIIDAHRVKANEYLEQFLHELPKHTVQAPEITTKVIAVHFSDSKHDELKSIPEDGPKDHCELETYSGDEPTDVDNNKRLGKERNENDEAAFHAPVASQVSSSTNGQCPLDQTEIVRNIDHINNKCTDDDIISVNGTGGSDNDDEDAEDGATNSGIKYSKKGGLKRQLSRTKPRKSRKVKFGNSTARTGKGRERRHDGQAEDTMGRLKTR